MKCESVEEMLSSYMDNCLKAADRKKIEAHLAGCQRCTNYFHAMVKVDNLIKLKAEEEPSKEYWDSYWARLSRKLEQIPAILQSESFPSENRSMFRQFIPRFALALNGVLMLFLILAGGLLHRNTQQIKSLRISLDEKRGGAVYPEIAERVLLPVTSGQTIEGVVRKQVKLFHEISEMFPHTIKWVVTNDGEIEMGLASSGALEKAVALKQSPIFLQFEVLCSSPVSEIVSSPRIMVLSGNEVNVRLGGLSETDKTIYQYHCFPVLRDDGEVGLTVRISLDNFVLDTSLIISEGERIKLGSLRKENAEYSVYVTICYEGLNVVKTESRGI